MKNIFKFIQSNRGIQSLLFAVVILTTSLFIQPFWQDEKSIEPEVRNAYAEMVSGQALRFIQNKGQVIPDVKYHVQGAAHTILFYPEKIELRRLESESQKNEISIQFEGANSSPAISGIQALPGVAHFYKGSDPSKWVTGASTFGSVLYEEVYPGIDMAYIGKSGRVESEFYLEPGADHSQIKVNYKGVRSLSINSKGELIISTPLGDLVEKAPIAFQEIHGKTYDIKVSYDQVNNSTIGFTLGKHDPEYPVTIDPELVFLTTVQGMRGGGEWAAGTAIEENGTVIMVGAANRFFPETDPIEGSNHESGLGNDGLLVKLDGKSGEVIYSALFGGSRLDYFNDIALDPQGNYVMTGITSSTDFPLMGAFQDSSGGGDDAFVTRISESGEILFSTYLGGSKRDWGEGITLDGGGNIYVSGFTESEDFPVLNAFQNEHAADTDSDFAADLFITKIGTDETLSFSTYLGGTGQDRLGGVAVGSNGEVTISGYTSSTDYPLFNAYQDTHMGGPLWSDFDLMATRLNAAGNELKYSTYLGGSNKDQAADVELDAMGHAFITGGTWSDDFPIIGGTASPETEVGDGILVQLDNSGQPVYSLRSNVPGYDFFDGVAVDSVAYAIGTWMDTIRVFEKAADQPLKMLMEVAAPGYSVNGVDYMDGYLAFAGTYWSDLKKSTQSSSVSLAGLMYLKTLYKIWIEDGILRIEIIKTSDEVLTPEVNEEGYLVLNGEELPIKAVHLRDMDIFGSKGNDKIDLSRLKAEDLPEIYGKTTILIQSFDGDDVIEASREIAITALGGPGNDIITGSDGPDIIAGGDGNDITDGRDGDDLLDGGDGADILRGGKGNNDIRGDSEDSLVENLSGDDEATVDLFKEIFIPNSTKGTNDAAEDHVLHIVDHGGLDSLDFSGSDYGITIDFTKMDVPQSTGPEGVDILLNAQFEIITGTGFDDTFTVAPLPDTALHLDGGESADVLHFISPVEGSTDNGSVISTPGFADVFYTNFESVNIKEISTGMNDPSGFGSGFQVESIYPNPFTDRVFIRFNLPTENQVQVKIYDIAGKQVALLLDQHLSAGENSAQWNGLDQDGSNANPGTYIYTIQSGSEKRYGKLVLDR